MGASGRSYRPAGQALTGWFFDKVEEYFSVAVFSVDTDPRLTESIPKGTETATQTTVEVSSSITSTLESFQSIKAVLKGKYGSLEAELEGTYSVKDVTEKSTSKLERETRTVSIGASTKNRLFVQWMFSKAVAIYRKKKSDKSVTLIGVSEWADEILDKVYEYD